jgi:hypothetical protein
MPCINIDEQEFSVSANVQIQDNWVYYVYMISNHVGMTIFYSIKRIYW